MEIYTIGFTQKSARQFFTTLKQARIEQLIDVRINNVSQLAGFTKKDDLAYFLEAICGASYIHEPLLAPTKELLDSYKKDGSSWADYEAKFLALMETRKIEDRIPKSLFDKRSVLLCSEPTPHKCHRRLVVEYLSKKWGPITVHNL